MSAYAGTHAYMVLTPSGQVVEYYTVHDGVRMVGLVFDPTTSQVRAFELRCAREGVPISRVVRKDAPSVPAHCL